MVRRSEAGTCWGLRPQVASVVCWGARRGVRLGEGRCPPVLAGRDGRSTLGGTGGRSKGRRVPHHVGPPPGRRNLFEVGLFPSGPESAPRPRRGCTEAPKQSDRSLPGVASSMKQRVRARGTRGIFCSQAGSPQYLALSYVFVFAMLRDSSFVCHRDAAMDVRSSQERKNSHSPRRAPRQ